MLSLIECCQAFNILYSEICAGAYGCTIAGAGPTVIAVAPSKEKGKEVAVAMQDAFRKYGKLDIDRSQVVRLNRQGTTKVYMK